MSTANGYGPPFHDARAVVTRLPPEMAVRLDVDVVPGSVTALGLESVETLTGTVATADPLLPSLSNDLGHLRQSEWNRHR